jgi:hypothetical protein
MSNIQEFNYVVDVMNAVLWQYNEAARIQSLLTSKNSWYAAENEQFWNDWYGNVFNLLTANLFGLKVWSIILELPLFVDTDPEPTDKPLFGFNELPTINGYVNFNNGNFSKRSGVINLTIEEQRLVLRLRYYQLVSRGAAPEVNTFLKTLFAPYGAVYMLDGLDMTITYVFNFNLSLNMRYILEYYDLLPRPAGVGIKYVIITGTIFGFNQVTTFPDYINVNQNFNNANFLPNFVLA